MKELADGVSELDTERRWRCRFHCCVATKRTGNCFARLTTIFDIMQQITIQSPVLSCARCLPIIEHLIKHVAAVGELMERIRMHYKDCSPTSAIGSFSHIQIASRKMNDQSQFRRQLLQTSKDCFMNMFPSNMSQASLLHMNVDYSMWTITHQHLRQP